MQAFDDDLSRFATEGAEPLPQTAEQGYIEREGRVSGMRPMGRARR
jgi:hypothetical protein